MKYHFVVAVVGASLLASVAQVNAQVFSGPYTGEVTEIIDGDTFEARVNIWPYQNSIVRVRLRGWDAPEIHRPECEAERLQGTFAAEIMEDILPIGQRIELRNVEPGSFSGRVIADVDRMADERGFSLIVLLARRGAIQEHDHGDVAIDWCAEDVE